ncbi:MAG: 2-iminoacetate synthase, partial [Limisphaerales bacterium]
MSFVTAFNALPFDALLQRARDASPGDVAQCLARGPRSLADFATLISPAAGQSLETLCANSQSLTRQRFGNVIRLFAPLYLSNECVNNCKYCGFSRDNPILRVTLSVDEVMREARELKSQGFRNILLVAGEHPKFISNGYMEECLRALHAEIPSLSLEVGPMETAEYEPL